MGPLLIVGGADKKHQLDIYKSFLENCLGGESSPSVAVIATAASNPEVSYGRIEEKLLNAGSCRPFLLSVDKGNESEILDQIDGAHGFWFTGGDQNQTVKALMDTSFLSAIRKRNEEGAVIAGTSAGAAIMSDPMICGGDTVPSLYSLFAEQSLDGNVETGRGFGFLSGVLVDQHFDARSRLGRLIAAMVNNHMSLGLGISENTGLLVSHNQCSVVGSGAVYRISLENLVRSERALKGVDISFFEKGDVFHLDSQDLDPGDKTLIGEDGVLSNTYPRSTGVFSPYADLRNFLARQLMDNEESKLFRDEERGSFYVTSHLFEPEFFPGETFFPALELRFHKIPEKSQAWADTAGGFTIQSVELEILKKEMAWR